MSARRVVASYRERIVDEIVRALGFAPSGTARRLIGPSVTPDGGVEVLNYEEEDSRLLNVKPKN